MKAVKIKSGEAIDRKTFEQLYHNYYSALCAFGYRYIKDSEVVEDLIQEVFVVFWEKKSGFNNLNSIKSFLYTSVRNKCLNLLKHQEFRQKNESEII
jgi:RNA polymerase sigma factor (sigma-70 family)